MMTEDKQDVISIKEWLAKEPYLPNDLDDFVLEKFLHSCYGSLERTKKCIEKFCTSRGIMTELYTARDPMLENLQTAFSVTNITTYRAGNQEILIYQYGDPTLENFHFYDLLTTLCIQADVWIKDEEFLPEGHIIIVDLKYFSLRMIPKANIFFFREFLIYLLEGMPVRVKEVYGVNSPTFVDKFLALVKPALPTDIYNMIRILPDYKSLHQFIDKKYLPKEYDGDAVSTETQYAEWQTKIKNRRYIYHSFRDTFIFLSSDAFIDAKCVNTSEYIYTNYNDLIAVLPCTRISIFQKDLWKADLKKKPKNNSIVDSMNGSFKTLCID